MEQRSEYIGILVTFLLAGGIATAIIILNALLGPKNKMNPVKAEPFECGKEPIQIVNGRMNVKFYLIGMLFILFDVEIVSFFSWAVILKKLGWTGIVEMFTFVFVLVLGYVYAWKKGALQWEK